MHGLGGSPAELQPLTVELRAAGYAVSAPLIHGPGGGTDLDSETRWTDWVDTAKEHFDELAKTCDTVHVCGFCGGALLAPGTSDFVAESIASGNVHEALSPFVP